MSLEDIAASLAAGRQRATYGAVAAIVGAIPRGLMARRPREPRYSWIVNAKTGRPTGYADAQFDPECLRQIRAGEKNVIRNAEDLKRWLKSQPR